MGQTPTKERKVPQGGLVFQLTRTDPDFKTKRRILVAVLKPVIARLDPSEWVPTFQKAYENLPSAAVSPLLPVSNASGQIPAAERDPTVAPRVSKSNMSRQ
jgi:hypothetical protein